MSKKLFDASDDESVDSLKLSTNKNYAISYNNFRRKELLKKYKDRGLEDFDSDSDSSSETSDDDDNEIVNAKYDQEFFKTLAALKSKDPTIYDKETRFFADLENADDKNDDCEEEKLQNKKEKKKKPITLKDYERKVILENNGHFDDDSEADINAEQVRAISPSAVEEERQLKEEFKKFVAADDSEEEEFGGIFKKRTKTKKETSQEEEDFAAWLAGQKTEIEDDAKTKLEPLKNYWNNSNLPQSERFLRDYILNKGYTSVNVTEIPTYDEIVGDIAPLSEDEQELEKQAEFEQKYNFRYEEPDEEFIKRYPRTIESSLRRTDDKRKQKRHEIKDRKEQAKLEKMKEINMIKEMKWKEISEKIKKLKAVTGNDELAFKDEELEEDFDPVAHDKRMNEIFNEEYYDVDEGEEKPECPSDIEELRVEDWDNYDPNICNDTAVDDEYMPHCEDDDFNMDCDYDPIAAKQKLQQELVENMKSKRYRRGKRNRFMEIIQAEKPTFNPEDEKTYGEYIDEYYKLDCEDIIGDLPCRFKYVETTPNDFGLTIEEILLAKNKELNQWASLKKAVSIRPDHVEKKEQRLYKMKAKNEDLKRKIFKSLYGESTDDEADCVEEAKGTSLIDGANKSKNALNESCETTCSVTMTKSMKRRKRRKEAAAVANNEESVKKTKLNTEIDKPKTAETKADMKTKTTEYNGSNNKNPPKHIEKDNTEENNHDAAISSKTNPFKQSEAVKTSVVAPECKFTRKKKPQTSNKFKKNKSVVNENPNGISDERLKAYGINPRKFHKKQKYGNIKVEKV